MIRLMRLFVLAILWINSSLCGGIREHNVPDLFFVIDPVAVNENQAVAGLLQAGLRDIRVNGTYAISFQESHLFKCTFEYLREKLGFHFESGHVHEWVDQYGVGAAYRLETPCEWIEYVDLGATYSHGFDKKLPEKLVPDENQINMRRICGADMWGVQAGSRWTIGAGMLGATLFYDYLQFNRKFEGKRILEGPGGGLHYHYPFAGFMLHLNGEIRRPYLFLEARINGSVTNFCKGLGWGLFIESTKGFDSIPNSTRFGIEISKQFGKSPSSSDCSCEDLEAVLCFARAPAIYRPQVLAISDEKVREFCREAGITLNIGTLTVPLGAFSFDASSYFEGGGPFIFFGTNFPSGFTIDPSTGVISGVADGSQPSTVLSQITAVSYCGTISQDVAFQFIQD